MIIYTFDCRPCTWRRVHQVTHELEIDVVMRLRIPGEIHELHREIDAFGRRVGTLLGENVLLAQDGRPAIDEQARALVRVGDDTLADDEAFTRLELDFERHGRLLTLGMFGRADRCFALSPYGLRWVACASRVRGIGTWTGSFPIAVNVALSGRRPRRPGPRRRRIPACRGFSGRRRDVAQNRVDPL